MAGMAIAISGIMLSGALAVIQWQMDTIHKRLDERLSIYQDQNETREKAIQALQGRVLTLERNAR